jgi:hypothetical protein
MKMNYLAALMILAILSIGLALPASAAYSNDTAIIQSNPVRGLVLDVMGEITTWDLTNIGDNFDNVNISMRIRSNTPWQINVYDALDGGSKPAGSAGHMAEYSVAGYNTTLGGRMLYYPLEIAWAEGETPVVLSGAEQKLKDGLPTPSGAGGGLGGLLYNLSVNQKLRYADITLPENYAYRIVVTFVAMNL